MGVCPENTGPAEKLQTSRSPHSEGSLHSTGLAGTLPQFQRNMKLDTAVADNHAAPPEPAGSGLNFARKLAFK